MALIGCLGGLLAGGEQIAATANYETFVARSLNFYTGDTRRFSISDPWSTLVGTTMICARLDVPDGRGGHAPTNDFSMYEFDRDRIKAMIKDNTLFGCPNRQYHPLPPATK